MRNISLIFKQFSKTVLLVAGFAILGFSARAQGDATKGEALFKANCTTCHKIESQLVGPALGPLVDAIEDFCFSCSCPAGNEDAEWSQFHDVL